MKDAKMREIRQFRVIMLYDPRKTFLKIEVCENISLEVYTHPHLTVVRIGDIQSISLYTPPYCLAPEALGSSNIRDIFEGLTKLK